MKEQTRANHSPAAYLGLAVLPMLVSLVLQVLCAVLFTGIAGAVKSALMTTSGITDQTVIDREVYRFIADNTAWSVFFYQLAALLVFGFWYAKSGEKKRFQSPKGILSVRTVAGMAVLGVGLEFFISAGVTAVGCALPELMNRFQELMENAGMGEATVASIAASVVLAPLGEELLCRGLIFCYAKKAVGSFTVANTIQALLFGVMHGNIVQGVYAFILGYLLGMLYEKFHSLYAPMLVHCVVNLTAFSLVPLILGPLPGTLMPALLVMAVSVAISAAGWYLINRYAVYLLPWKSKNTK